MPDHRVPGWDGRVRMVDEFDPGSLSHQVQVYLGRDRTLVVAVEPAYRPRESRAVYFRHVPTETLTPHLIQRLKSAIAQALQNRARRP